MLMPMKTTIRQSDDPTTEWVDVTPTTAKDWLTRNIEHNRNLKEHLIGGMARDMAEGKWRQNGAAIVFDDQGRLIDGQHRLNAIVKSGATIRMLVVANVHSQAFTTIDQGAKRTAADILHTLGEKDAAVLGSAMQLIWRDLRSLDPFQGVYSPSMTEAADTVRQVPEVRGVINRARCVFGLLPPSVAVWLRWRFEQADRELAHNFFQALASGENLKRGDPRYTLREALITRQGPSMRLDRKYKAAITIKAWNAVRQHREVRHLRWTKDEGFPVIA